MRPLSPLQFQQARGATVETQGIRVDLERFRRSLDHLQNQRRRVEIFRVLAESRGLSTHELVYEKFDEERKVFFEGFYEHIQADLSASERAVLQRPTELTKVHTKSLQQTVANYAELAEAFPELYPRV